MEVIGIICEYNPLHLGHKKQIDLIRSQHPDGGIVCLMSGNYVQRGAPAVFDKTLRAKAAILSGADLVLELPITATLSSAEGFASEGVRILKGFCNYLCFGAESGNEDALLTTAKALLQPEFSQFLRAELDKGVSFPVARQNALKAMGISEDTLSRPNDILATEYCKAILQQNCPMVPMPIVRQGDYHDRGIDPQNPSATALRQQIKKGDSWLGFTPEEARDVFTNASFHSIKFGEQAMVYRLQTMTDGDFEKLPYGSEGLWRKLMQNARKYAALEEIITATKSKRYTRTRLDRMVMCAFLGITEQMLAAPAPYVRVLALNDKGREILKSARQTGLFLNAGERMEDPYQALENRAGMLYSIFAEKEEPPYHEEDRRIFYKK